MSQQIYRVENLEEYRHAGDSNLIRLLPVPGSHPLFIPKRVLGRLVCAIESRQFVHLSGPTGTAKTSLIEALTQVPENFAAICEGEEGISNNAKIKSFPIVLQNYHTCGELYDSWVLKDGKTLKVPSTLVTSLKEAETLASTECPLIWIREMGRVHDVSVQCGLIDLMTTGTIVLPDGSHISGAGIAWVADSNYKAAESGNYNVVPLDLALKRRLCVPIDMDYLASEDEVALLEKLEPLSINEHNLISKVVKLGMMIRAQQESGSLQSVPPPTISGYLTYLKMARKRPTECPRDLTEWTILGHASNNDKQVIIGLLNEVFGVEAIEDEPTLAENLF